MHKEIKFEFFAVIIWKISISCSAALKTLENQWFYDAFREYRNGTLTFKSVIW